MSRAGDPGTAPLSTTARAILAEFADSFPHSAHYRGGRRLRKAGWERLFPQIVTDVEAKEAFLDAVDELVRLRFVSVRWKRFREGNEVDGIYLEDPQRLFEVLGRASPEDVRRSMIEELDRPEWHDAPADAIVAGRLSAVRSYLRAALDARHPVAVEDANYLRDLARLLRVRPEQADALPLRALSVRLFADSKRLERLLPVADRVTRAVTGEAVSEELGLARTYPEASIAFFGEVRFAAGDDHVWRCHGEPVTLPADTIGMVASVVLHADGPAPMLLSVENKETFYILAQRLRARTLPDGFRAIAYCGGHPHRSYTQLLQCCADSGALLNHFGDLDPDGVLIYGELQSRLAARIEPYLMDVQTYRTYRAYGYDPPAQRFEQLAASLSSLPPPILPLAHALLECRTGVEQEVIDVRCA